MHRVLQAERRVTFVDHTRMQPCESAEMYTSRMTDAFSATGAQIAWLCVPPGPHVPCMMRAAIGAGLHVMAEKPWLYSREETHTLIASARSAALALGIHFEYCLLDEIQSWRERFIDIRPLRFSGRFHVSERDRLGIPPLVNLGCHLLAMHRYAVPHFDVTEVSCEYAASDQRCVSLERPGGESASGRESAFVDFTHNRQPVIQRFIRLFEAATEGAAFSFGLEFAWSVAEDLLGYSARELGRPG